MRRTPVRRLSIVAHRPLFAKFFWLFVAACIGLGWLGTRSPEGIYLTLARVLTLYYFAFFLLVLPILGLFEKPGPLPASIAKPVVNSNT